MVINTFYGVIEQGSLTGKVGKVTLQQPSCIKNNIKNINDISKITRTIE
jgi:hypothetical protein